MRGALNYIPAAEAVLRQRRMKRAMDLSLKHQSLPAQVQDVQVPGDFYLAPVQNKLQQLAEERELLQKGA